MGITIKGKPGGLFEIEAEPLSSYSEIRDALKEKLDKNKDFFTGAGAKLLFSGRPMTKAQKQDLKRMLHMDYDVDDVSFEDEREAMPQETMEAMSLRRADSDAKATIENRVDLISKEYFNAKSIFISHTLRSGQRVECEGDIVVLGDVNDGAEVIAGGSIAVMGVLCGLAHAGATGRADVVVAANELRPKQLRISGKIAMFPESEISGVPEIAEYSKGSIVIRAIKPPARPKQQPNK
jgi:septum site-determining protein MinC